MKYNPEFFQDIRRQIQPHEQVVNNLIKKLEGDVMNTSTNSGVIKKPHGYTKPNRKWLPLTTIAAGLILVIAAVVLIPKFSGIVPPVDPNSNNIIEPSKTEPTPVKTEATTIKTEPTPVPPGIGGAEYEKHLYLSEFFIVQDMFWGNYVGDSDGYTKWVLKMRAQKLKEAGLKSPYDDITVMSEGTIVDYIKEFNITKDTFIKINKVGDDFQFFTNEQIEALYSFNERRINEMFIHPLAVMSDTSKIYPLQWFIDNPTNKWHEADISAETIARKIEDWRQWYDETTLREWGVIQKAIEYCGY